MNMSNKMTQHMFTNKKYIYIITFITIHMYINICCVMFDRNTICTSVSRYAYLTKYHHPTIYK